MHDDRGAWSVALVNLESMTARFERDDPGRGRGAAMVGLLRALDASLDASAEGPVWLLRSLTSVVLLSSEDWQSPWHVRIDVDAFPFPNLDPAHLHDKAFAPVS